MAALQDLIVNQRYRLPAALLSVQYSRSGGPGGQNVNKVATKVDLRLDLESAAEHLPEAYVKRIRTRLANRLDAEGRLQVVSSEHREQARNLQAAQIRMKNMLDEAVVVQKTRKPTRPTRASKERRLDEKRRRSLRKQRRSKLDD